MTLPDDTREEVEDIPLYDDPQRSRLEPFTDFIRELRQKRYPYRLIAQKIRDKGVSICWQGVQKFCRKRGIVKGAIASSKPQKEPDPRRQRIAERVARRKKEQETEKAFTYDGFDKPIRTWRDEV